MRFTPDYLMPSMLTTPNKTYAFFVKTPEIPVNHTWSSKHPVLFKTFSDIFYGTDTFPFLKHCSSMEDWMKCSEMENVYTGKRVSAAWDDYADQLHTVWVNQNRKSDNQSREIFISTGFVGGGLLPKPNPLGVRSNVSPGIACHTYAASGYDCIVAYTRQDVAFPAGQVAVKRFYATPGSNGKYELAIDNIESNVVSNVSTASAITAWYRDGYFYIAIRPTRRVDHQALEIYYSTDSLTWTNLKQNLGHSVDGPSAITNFDGSGSYLSRWWE